jgi:hypothetical protein
VAETAVVSLDQYRQEHYNVLVPTATMQQISPYHRLRVEEVKINPNPVAGDVFKVGSKKVSNKEWEDVLSLSKTAILKLANAAGIIWNWHDTRVITASRDYVLYQAVGAIRKPSGEWIPLKGTKEIDLTVIEEEIYDQKQKAAAEYNKSEAWVKQQVRNNMIQWRKNKLMRAETGAMLRVVRALLSIKHQYSPAELQKPFIVPRVDFSPDYSDPEVRRMILTQGIQATSQLFGQAAAAQSLPPAQALEEAMDVASFQEATETFIDADQMSEEHIAEEPMPEPESIPEPESESEPIELESWSEDQSEQNQIPGTEDPICMACGRPVSDRVAQYSQRKFGDILCYTCQRGGAV